MWVRVYNKSVTWGYAFVMAYLFIEAWFNNYIWCFGINLSGEALIEMIVLILWVVSIIILTYHNTKQGKIFEV